MRTIKFRVWDNENKRFFPHKRGEWFNVGSEGDFFHGFDGDIDEPNQKRWEVMQFTGLKDKNGVEIYEGDTLRVQSQYETNEPVDSAPNEVYFRDGAFRCGFHDMILGEKVCTGKEGNWNMEVIGNSHQNPELLEKEPRT